MRAEYMKLKLVLYPDPILRKGCEPVEKVTDDIRELAESMLEFMRAENGIGLAAPQVGKSVSLLVIAYEEEGIEPTALINPRITARSGSVEMNEGCLSFPNIFAKLTRPEFVTIKALNLEGENVTIEAEGLFARVLQHEIDHLSGVVFIDHFSPVQKIKWRGALKDLERLYKVGRGV